MHTQFHIFKRNIHIFEITIPALIKKNSNLLREKHSAHGPDSMIKALIGSVITALTA